jgi:hypothetical protein
MNSRRASEMIKEVKCLDTSSKNLDLARKIGFVFLVRSHYDCRKGRILTVLEGGGGCIL